jgi:hypothetical protein
MQHNGPGLWDETYSPAKVLYICKTSEENKPSLTANNANQVGTEKKSKHILIQRRMNALN